MRRSVIALGLAPAACGVQPGEAFPSRPINIIVPWGAIA